ncbi:MAG TPA: bifunctional nuclease family protein [Acidimicrobiales bacterium]|jgi:hypothetical protein|nr:bifunctional nuclease family protein [Acidimicrobiales bacterium]
MSSVEPVVDSPKADADEIIFEAPDLGAEPAAVAEVADGDMQDSGDTEAELPPDAAAVAPGGRRADAAEAPDADQLAPDVEQMRPVDGAPDADEAPAAEEDEPLGLQMPPAMSLMDFVDVVLTLPSTHPVVVLQETELPYRELRIPIGGPEGIAIGYAARKMATPRPLTHELVVQLLEQFNLTLELVKITDVQGSMFTAEITVSGANGSKTLDCRPSDAIALALRHRLRVPILAAPDVLDRAGGAAGGAN